MAGSIEQYRNKLWSAYGALPDECRHMVNLLAVNWGSLSKTELRNGLRKLLGTQRSAKAEPADWLNTGLLETETAWNGSERYYCNPVVTELVVRALVAEGSFDGYVELARLAAPLGRNYARNNNDIRFESDDQLIREVRIGLYRGDEAYVSHLFEILKRNQYSYWDGLPARWPGPERIYAMVCDNPFNAAWFQTLPSGIRNSALPELVDHQLARWQLEPVAYRMLTELCRDTKSSTEALIYSATYAALLRGETAAASELMGRGTDSAQWTALRALSLTLAGNLDLGIAGFEAALKQLRKETGSRRCTLDGIDGVVYILALSLRNQGTDMEDARRLLDMTSERYGAWAEFRQLRLALDIEKGTKGALRDLYTHLTRSFASRNLSPWSVWLGLFILHRYDSSGDVGAYLPRALLIQARAKDDGLDWLAAELGDLIGQFDRNRDDLRAEASRFQASSGCRLLISHVRHEAPWERALNAIHNAIGKAQEVKGINSETEFRLAWYISELKGHGNGYDIEAREQKRVGGGAWSKGKILSLKKVLEMANGKSGYLSEQDLRLATNIVVDRDTRGYELSDRGWLALAGHPHVFSAQTGASLEMVLGTPEFRVRKVAKKASLELEFWPKLKHDPALVVVPDGFNRLKLIEIKPEHRKLAEIIGPGIQVPESASERVAATLGEVSSLVAIQSDISGGEFSSAESVDADPRPRVQLNPDGEGLRMALLVRPFGERGSYLEPGKGSRVLVAELEGTRFQTQRDLKQEQSLAKAVIESCPTLSKGAESLVGSQWLVNDPESSLELLLELQALGDRVQIEWPQGEKFRVLGQAGLSQFGLKVQQQRDWFGVQGQLKLESGEVIEMQRLLELLDESRGRFIRLDEGRFLALTDAFRKRLEDLRAYTEKHGKDQRISPLALPILDDLAEEVGEMESDAAWKKQLDKLRRAEVCQPKLPSTLQAELRDYQKEGFEWLSRLAAWGVGACLADDMGLGKTLQAIALILSRAALGPTLVVAPTSVCFNWQNEVARFAPTLRARTLAPGDREQQVEQLQAMDLLICSYGLLQQDAVGEVLAKVSWNTIVLDEAQSIKNPATKRAKQAAALRGEFKIITTGTPIENHLGELWALFRFINPGLLGSLESFNRRFAIPIERNQNRDTRQRLKRLIQPFILRRTKAQVLDELPPRTEIELQVELSEKEASFYEALRRNLIAELDHAEQPGEDRRFQVLAAITKLRRACCNTSLIAPDLGLPSSKLDLFAEVLEELLVNRHKVLVFSQFVDHLEIIRRLLDNKGISYQYLDGQTPANARRQRVEAFQSGAGDVFLISLKAGGTGLNLTAADYVIHMDPWWNPAVEDQASDRAHRIGQQRPVTVYRLVTAGTIEEQIVSLHRQKRDLADNLLEGGELSAKIQAEDLLNLMRETAAGTYTAMR